MKYDVNYSCGHSGEVDLGGKCKDRERMLEWYERCGLCPECYKNKLKKEAEMERKIATELYEKYSLCPLKGTEKQIAYAEKYRSSFVKTISNVYKEEVPPLILDMLKNMDSAKWYIEHAMDDSYISSYKQMLVNVHRQQDNNNTIDKKEKDLYIVPKNKTKNLEIEIIMKTHYISIRFPYDKECIDIIHTLHYSWDSSAKEWYLNLDETTGNRFDRVAESASYFLDKGYVVKCDCTEGRTKLESGDWEPLHMRWIDYNDKTSTFFILDRDKNDKVFKHSKTIHGSFYKDYRIQVPEQSVNELNDFAGIFDFKYTDKALNRMNDLQREMLILDHDPIINKVLYDDDKLEKLMDNSSIPSDLHDN